MTVIGIGVDIIEVARIRASLERHGERFHRRICTEGEAAYCTRMRDPAPFFAARFAAKEAVLKVLGTGWRGGIAWTDVEIVKDPSGQPKVALSGECARIAVET